MKYDYGFCGLLIDNPTLKKIVDRIPEKIVYDEEGFGKEYNAHITLLYGFLPDVKVEDIKKILEKYKTIEFTLKDLSLFYNEDFDVLKIGVESKILNEINKEMQKLSCVVLHPEYKAHITLAYLNKNDSNKKLERNLKNFNISSNKIKFTSADDNTTFFQLN